MAFLDEGGVADLTEQIRTLADATYVPVERTINGVDLSANMNLTANDVNAVPLST